ncbi:MAG: 4Fe-4S dicluster domain-containing protein [bacterium]
MFTKRTLEEFVVFLKKNNWEVYGPKKDEQEGRILAGQIDRLEELLMGSELPFYSFKKFFVPEQETLFEYNKEALKIKINEGQKKAILGMNILDLRAVLLYDQVFEKDAYYHTRRQKMLIVGHSLIPPVLQNIFEAIFEEDVLEHLSFDIFLASGNRKQPARLDFVHAKSGGDTESAEEFVVFTGSPLGQKILDDFGYDEYIHIQFSGPVREGKLDERMLKLKNNLENKHNQKIWDELGKRCIECGKCTIICPTCFCFRIDDEAALAEEKGERQRCWDACFYQEFSEVALSHKFLNSAAARIYFWYFHKFARIPEEFNFMGCVGCHRCAAVCPVGIDIAEVLKEIERS